MQPFKETSTFRSSLWPELEITKKQYHLLFYHPHPLQTVSSAVYGGGWKDVNYLINWQVPIDYAGKNPTLEVEEQLRHWNYPVQKSLAFQTAAYIDLASIQQVQGDQYKIICCVTAGVGNKARAGKKRKTFPAYQPGTINILLFIDGKMTQSAMVNAIITATEAKSAALQDLMIRDDDGDDATGTTTDAVVIAVSKNSTYEKVHLYSGSATSIGNAIGCLVYDAVKESLSYLT